MLKRIGLILLISSMTSALSAQDTVYSDTLTEEGISAPVVDEEFMEEIPASFNEFRAVDSITSFTERPWNHDKVNELRKEEDYWYANQLPPQSKPKAVTNDNLPKKGFDLVFWILLGLGIAGLLTWFTITVFRSRSKTVREDIQFGEDSENIYELEFDPAIREAVSKGNFRLAVRLLYLQQLRLLSDRGLIQYGPDKTNSQYLFQLGNTNYYKDFFRLTRHFEYIWYGKFELNASQFHLIQKDFSDFKSRVQV